MKENILLVYPTLSQLEYIKINYSENIYYVVSHNKLKPGINMYIVDNNVGAIPKDVRVFCCHEEGIYWLKCNFIEGWQIQFSDNLFRLLLKDKFKEYLTSIGIKNTSFYYSKHSIVKFPVVMKPIIGFGSIGVKKINTEYELENYIGNNNLSDLLSSISVYKNIYFPEEENRCIFEEYIDGEFFRVPFIMIDKDVKYVFPIKGNKTTYKTNSDFHWTEFELGQESVHITNSMKEVLNILTSKLDMKSGVFVAEFIIDKNGCMYLLEMSPRQSSSRINKMVEYYSGINLELLAVDLFFSKHDILLNTETNRIRMQLFRENFNLKDDSNILSKIEEVSVYGDKMITVFSKG